MTWRIIHCRRRH